MAGDRADTSELRKTLEWEGWSKEEIDKEFGYGRFVVEHTNIEAYMHFLCLKTQWKHLLIPTDRGVNVIQTGLDYAGTAAYLGMVEKPKKARRLFKQIRLIEQGYLSGQS